MQSIEQYGQPHFRKIVLIIGGLAILLAGVSSPFSPRVLSQTTTSYTGYQVVGDYPTLRVEGSWIVPAANCTITPYSISNISVIIDGISGEGDAMQIGTYQDCTNGIASYGAFVQIYPMISYYGVMLQNSSGTYKEANSTAALSGVAIHPGDVVEAQGTWRNDTTKPINWNTDFVDETTGILVDTDAIASASFTPVLNSGALILSSDGQALTDFTSPLMSGRLYTNVLESDITGPQFTGSTFGETANDTGFSLVSLQMPGMRLGPLADNGSSFEVAEEPGLLTATSIGGASSSTEAAWSGSSSAASSITARTSTSVFLSPPGSSHPGSSPINESIYVAVAVVVIIVIGAAFYFLRKK